ncbi:MAG TPA: hypothetical protein VF556_09145 [Pyrinomonadaceae bacterium]|jgi:hypothetical protein
MTNDLPVTTKRQAGYFFGFFIILSFIGVLLLFFSEDRNNWRTFYGWVLLALAAGAAFCLIRLNSTQKAF